MNISYISIVLANAQRYVVSGLKELPRVVGVFTACRQAAWDTGFLQMQRRLRVSGMTIILGTTFQFLQSRDHRPELENITHATILHELVHVGKSSYHTEATLKRGPVPLIRNYISWVYCDRKTRNPTPIPEWFKDQFRSGTVHSGSRSENLVLDFELADNLAIASREVKIQPEHIDKFGHTNHECYIEFLTDLLFVNRINTITCGDIGNIRNDVRDGNDVRMSFKMLFSGESRLGEKVVAMIAQPTLKDVVVNIQAQVKKDGKSICKCSIAMNSLTYINSKI